MIIAIQIVLAAALILLATCVGYQYGIADGYDEGYCEGYDNGVDDVYDVLSGKPVKDNDRHQRVG